MIPFGHNKYGSSFFLRQKHGSWASPVKRSSILLPRAFNFTCREKHMYVHLVWSIVPCMLPSDLGSGCFLVRACFIESYFMTLRAVNPKPEVLLFAGFKFRWNILVHSRNVYLHDASLDNHKDLVTGSLCLELVHFGFANILRSTHGRMIRHLNFDRRRP